jgi:hypothetical protein
MRLIGSSNPRAVEDEEARRLLRQRVVLTTAVCRELQRVDERDKYRRAEAALGFLLSWVDRHFETGVVIHPGDGMEDMIIPDGASHLLPELWDGIQVCDAFAMLMTADYPAEYERDEARIRELLEDYSY